VAAELASVSEGQRVDGGDARGDGFIHGQTGLGTAKIGSHPSRAEHHNGDPAGLQFPRHTARHHVQCTFCRAVLVQLALGIVGISLGFVGDGRSARRDVNDKFLGATFNVGREGFAHSHHAHDVSAEREIPGGVIGVTKLLRMAALHRRVIEQDVDWRSDGGREGVDAGVVGNVKGLDVNVIGSRESVEVSRGIGVATRGKHSPTVGGVAFGEAEAEASVGAGDKNGGHSVFLSFSLRRRFSTFVVRALRGARPKRGTSR
jgi:hypothetical protein